MCTLVITPCSAQKRGNVPYPATAATLADPERRRRAETRLAAFVCPVMDMYTGTHHRLVMEGIRAVWARWGRHVLELAILSGGYGLLPADEPIIPYDVSLNDMAEDELAEWLARLQISSDYNLVFYLLSGRCLAALGLPLDVPDTIQQIILTGRASLSLIPAALNLHAFVAAEEVAAQRWHVKSPHVRGFLNSWTAKF
jgi:hypothetical protein